jgi:hypothetical protein
MPTKPPASSRSVAGSGTCTTLQPGARLFELRHPFALCENAAGANETAKTAPASHLLNAFKVVSLSRPPLLRYVMQ